MITLLVIAAVVSVFAGLFITMVAVDINVPAKKIMGAWFS